MGAKGRSAVVLLSGGLDSATALAIADHQGYQCHTLSFRYGQRHKIELEAAKKIAQSYHVKKRLVMDLDLDLIGGSALTDRIPVPKGQPLEIIGAHIPVTYVPARNTIFLSIALAWAESLGSTDIFIGVNALDYSGYPDCRPEYIQAFESMAALGTKTGTEDHRPVKIHTPLIEMTKAEIIRTGTDLGVDYSLTHSCYDPMPSGLACGECESCRLRQRGFERAGVPDPTRYAARTSP